MSDIRKALEALESVLCDPEGKAGIHGSDADMKIIDDALDQLRAQPEANEEIQELRAQVEAWRKQCDTLTNQVICCGVAARHPDATLTTRGAYAGKWNSPQAEAVRKLRAERDALLATPPTEPQAAQPARVWDEFGRTNAGDETGGSVQRFGFDISGSKPDIIPATNGAFVYYTDYLALHRRLATPPTEPATQANVGLGNSRPKRFLGGRVIGGCSLHDTEKPELCQKHLRSCPEPRTVDCCGVVEERDIVECSRCGKQWSVPCNFDQDYS